MHTTKPESFGVSFARQLETTDAARRVEDIPWRGPVDDLVRLAVRLTNVPGFVVAFEEALAKEGLQTEAFQSVPAYAFGPGYLEFRKLR